MIESSSPNEIIGTSAGCIGRNNWVEKETRAVEMSRMGSVNRVDTLPYNKADNSQSVNCRPEALRSRQQHSFLDCFHQLQLQHQNSMPSDHKMSRWLYVLTFLFASRAPLPCAGFVLRPSCCSRTTSTAATVMASPQVCIV